MNNSTGKWLIRVGSLILLVGFFIPSMAVSCSALGTKQSFSLYDLANAGYPQKNPLLFLVLLGALAAAVLTVIANKTREQRLYLQIGELVSVGIGGFSLLITILSLYNQFSGAAGGMGLEYSLEFGFFILLLGYLLNGAGIVLDYLEGRQAPIASPASYPPAAYPAVQNPPPRMEAAPVPGPGPAGMDMSAQAGGARLEIKTGRAPATVFPLTDRLYVGRSSDCQLRLPDSQVSRLHARFRFGNGSWFIQDQGSTTGTFVNGKRVQAIKLNSGDQVKIGDTILTICL
jgi:hypothetical protein